MLIPQHLCSSRRVRNSKAQIGDKRIEYQSSLRVSKVFLIPTADHLHSTAHQQWPYSFCYKYIQYCLLLQFLYAKLLIFLYHTVIAYIR